MTVIWYIYICLFTFIYKLQGIIINLKFLKSPILHENISKIKCENTNLEILLVPGRKFIQTILRK